ncbi:hypothetical protein EV426DRAFT_711981 [Tirmania nivea]|nr:hypothetical protein EV426DRAFT_711981 [Tirmania nivea]
MQEEGREFPCLRYQQWHASDVDHGMRPMSTSGIPPISTLPRLHETKQVPLTEHTSDVDSAMPACDQESSSDRELSTSELSTQSRKREESFHASDVDSGMPPMSTLPCLRIADRSQNYPMQSMKREESFHASDVDTAVSTMSLPPSL